MINHERSAIRKRLQNKRLTLDIKDRAKREAVICHKLHHHFVLQHSQKVAGYLSKDGEVDIACWFKKAWSQNKTCYLPKIIDNRLLFVEYDETTTLIPNRWGILEPLTNEAILPSALDAVITPLLAFDAHGNRLGRGAGYYDRCFAFLKNNANCKKPYLIGVGYSFQQVETLSVADWDVPLHHVITEGFTF